MSAMSRILLAFLAFTLVFGCAAKNADINNTGGNDDIFVPTEQTVSQDQNDPFETLNRLVFSLNWAIDTLIFEPVSRIYRFVLPHLIQDNIRNFAHNLRSPIILANNLLQGDFEAAKGTFTRFFVNSIVGMGGIVDIAVYNGYEYEGTDFGQTLAIWGVAEGPYLVFPIIGPSSLRGALGLLGDYAMDPLSYVASDDFILGLAAAEAIDIRARNIGSLEELERDSLDYYARTRSVYRQFRQNRTHKKENNSNRFTNGETDFDGIFPDDDGTLAPVE